MLEQQLCNRWKSSGGIVARINCESGMIERRQSRWILLANTSPPREEPRHQRDVVSSRGEMQRRPPVAIARMKQREIGLQQTNRRPAVTTRDRRTDLILRRRDGRVQATHLLAAMPLLCLDHGDHVGVISLFGQSHRRRGIAMRKDPLARVRARLHQQPHHRHIAPQHRVVNGAVLVARRRIHAHQFRPAREHRPDLGQVPALRRLHEPGNVRPIDKCLQLRPACKAVSPRNHTLSIVEREAIFVRMQFEAVDLGHRRRLTGAIAAEQFLGLLA